MRNIIIRGDSSAACRNLAVEALLFEALGPDSRALFLWQNKNTVVVGRHQNAWRECRVGLLEAEGGYLARRSSGGGAVYHDLGNLNFSFVVPRTQYDVHRQLAVVQSAVAEFGIRAGFTGRNDLVVPDSGAKFSGNAFRFSGDSALHHGTIMADVALDRLTRYLAPDAGKLRAKGIDSVRSRVCNLRDLCPCLTIPALTEAMERAFEREYGPAEVLPIAGLDADRLARLEREYDSWEFRLGKALPFDVTLERRFEWGGVTLEMKLRQGVVTEARAYSDAMDEAMIARLAPALTDARFNNAALSAALRMLRHPQADELADWMATTDLGGHDP